MENVKPDDCFILVRTGQGRLHSNETEEQALTEATRLCRKENDSFYVARVTYIKVVKPAEPPVAVIDL
jgi:hypothetical protein